MSKQATLTLIHRATPDWSLKDTNGMPRITHHFTVEKITDSVEFLPGQDLSREQVTDLCQNSAWKVIIQKPKG